MTRGRGNFYVDKRPSTNVQESKYVKLADGSATVPRRALSAVATESHRACYHFRMVTSRCVQRVSGQLINEELLCWMGKNPHLKDGRFLILFLGIFRPHDRIFKNIDVDLPT